jgi:AcrR family transcriptional regulator
MSERLRDRKKRRTRESLIATAYRLFDAQGYDRTTTAEIAAAADVSVATLYNHFPTKERLVFTDDGRDLIQAAIEAIPGASSPQDALRAAMDRILDGVVATTRDPAGELEQIRIRLMATVPSLRPALLERVFDTQEQLADALRAAFPGELDNVEAAAMVGGVIGAGLAAGLVAVRDGTPLAGEAVRRAIEMALR